MDQRLLGCFELRESVEHAGHSGTHIDQLAAVAGLESLLSMKVLGSEPFGKGLLIGELLYQTSLPGGIETLGLLAPVTLKTKPLGVADGLQSGDILSMLQRQAFGFGCLCLLQTFDLASMTLAQPLELTTPGLLGPIVFVYQGVRLGRRAEQVDWAHEPACRRGDCRQREQNCKDSDSRPRQTLGSAIQQ
jgi:hypothetical protein